MRDTIKTTPGRLKFSVGFKLFAPVLRKRQCGGKHRNVDFSLVPSGVGFFM